jgi:hypothetical protein
VEIQDGALRLLQTHDAPLPLYFLQARPIARAGSLALGGTTMESSRDLAWHSPLPRALDIMNSMQGPPGATTRYILAGTFRATASWARAANLSLREWVFIETDADLQVYERTSATGHAGGMEE